MTKTHTPDPSKYPRAAKLVADRAKRISQELPQLERTKRRAVRAEELGRRLQREVSTLEEFINAEFSSELLKAITQDFANQAVARVMECAQAHYTANGEAGIVVIEMPMSWCMKLDPDSMLSEMMAQYFQSRDDRQLSARVSEAGPEMMTKDVMYRVHLTIPELHYHRHVNDLEISK